VVRLPPVAGSARLVQGLTELGLVDEYRLMVYPILLGAGRRLFADTGATRSLRATDVRPVGDAGVAVLTYIPAT
jgi:dihydrofolate reductase